MVARWLSDAFQRFLRIFTGNGEDQEEESPNDAHQVQASPNSGGVSASAGTGRAGGAAKPAERAKEAGTQLETPEATKELFDNEYRRRAEEEAELRAECFKRADEAREDGDHDAANKHVKEAKEHGRKMKEANEEAVKYIMRINPNNTADTIDLHGLHVDEAMEEVKKKLASVTQGNLHIIPGRGSHSVNQQAKIKPKLINYLKENNYNFAEDNPGSLTVRLS